MEQQLLFAAILAGFATGVSITWFASRRRIASYRREIAVVLDARDDILAYVKVLSKLVPQGKNPAFRKHGDDTLQLLNSINAQIEDLQKRLESVEFRQKAHSQQIKRSIELNHLSIENGRALATSGADKVQGTALRTAREDQAKCSVSFDDPKPITGLLQHLVDLVSEDKRGKSIVSFPVEPLSVRPAVARTTHPWERLT